MPNLQQNLELKETYYKLKKSEQNLRNYILKKSFDGNALTKAFSFDQKAISESFQVSPGTPTIIKYFENVTEEEVVLLFIDIATFSEITEKKSNSFITSYLTNYYNCAIPIIYDHGGQIEKLMGDGIICLFGKPFIDVSWSQEFNKAELCAQDIINSLKGTNKEVKIALHSGAIKYFKTPVKQYVEYTMIGKAITELYRLESVARKNAINFYAESIYDGMNPSTGVGLSAIAKEEVSLLSFDVNLKGTNFTKVKYLKI